MFRNRETAKVWDKMVSLNQDRCMEIDQYDITYDILCNEIKTPEARTLEIGRGPGNIANYIAARNPIFKIFAIVSSEKMIEQAKKMYLVQNFGLWTALI